MYLIIKWAGEKNAKEPNKMCHNSLWQSMLKFWDYFYIQNNVILESYAIYSENITKFHNLAFERLYFFFYLKAKYRQNIINTSIKSTNNKVEYIKIPQLK